MTENLIDSIDGLMGSIRTIDDAINTAQTIERQGQEFYQSKAATIMNIAAKDLFIYLAAEEGRHIDYLTEFRENGGISHLNVKEPRDFSQLFASEFTGENPGEMDVLLGALRFEQKNEELYRELASWTDEPDQKAFFEMMSSFEHGHMELIDGFIEEVTQFRMQT